MQLPNKDYDVVAKIFHWVIAVLVVAVIVIALFMTNYFKLHKSFGMLIGLLMIIRIVWRIKHHVAALPKSIPRWQVVTSHIVQGLMYLCLLLLPILGFVASSLSGRPLAFFELNIPTWVTANHAWSQKLFNLHEIFAWVLIGLIAIHLLAVLQHFFAKDKVLDRMWF